LEVIGVKVVFCNKLNRLWLDHIEELRREFSEVDFITEEERIDSEIEHADALVGGELAIDVIKRVRNLKIIFVPYAGVDALPLAHIRERGIKISNVHGNAPCVAERAIAMALSFYGKIIDYHYDLKNAHWHGYWAKASVTDTWNSIQGRTCAVVGVGEIGKCIAKYLKVFDCRVIGIKKRAAVEKLEYFDDISLDLNDALEKSELIFVTLPLTEETRGMFDAEILGRLKGKFLVNVGRGEVVDEEGLYRSLKEGILKGAGIDVWYTYPGKDQTTAHPSKYPIHELPNVVLSPHLAGFTPQAARLNIGETIENIRSFIKTGKAKFEIDPQLTY
jgi:phosphoglycerate dehydrogenase-like enzyme